MTATRFKKGVMALVAGCLLNYLGDHLLGVRIELFWGLSTFSLLWFLDVFIVPFIAGIAVVLMTGHEKESILSRIRDTAVDQALFKPITLAQMNATVQVLLHP